MALESLRNKLKLFNGFQNKEQMLAGGCGLAATDDLAKK
jgi:hypothetical protein